MNCPPNKQSEKKVTGWDVAWVAVYLASDKSRWVTGASISVDGDQMILREFPG